MEKNLMFILGGFTAGYLLGVLTAPSKGRTTRKKLKYQADLMKDQIEDTLEEAKQEAKRVKNVLN